MRVRNFYNMQKFCWALRFSLKIRLVECNCQWKHSLSPFKGQKFVFYWLFWWNCLEVCTWIVHIARTNVSRKGCTKSLECPPHSRENIYTSDADIGQIGRILIYCCFVLANNVTLKMPLLLDKPYLLIKVQAHCSTSHVESRQWSSPGWMLNVKCYSTREIFVENYEINLKVFSESIELITFHAFCFTASKNFKRWPEKATRTGWEAVTKSCKKSHLNSSERKSENIQKHWSPILLPYAIA